MAAIVIVVFFAIVIAIAIAVVGVIFAPTKRKMIIVMVCKCEKGSL